MRKIICNRNNNRIYFIENGYLCSGIKGKTVIVKESTVKKLGLYEGDKIEKPMKQRLSKKDFLPRKFYFDKKSKEEK